MPVFLAAAPLKCTAGVMGAPVPVAETDPDPVPVPVPAGVGILVPAAVGKGATALV